MVKRLILNIIASSVFSTPPIELRAQAIKVVEIYDDALGRVEVYVDHTGRDEGEDDAVLVSPGGGSQISPLTEARGTRPRMVWGAAV